jgi:hypothetical protein
MVHRLIGFTNAAALVGLIGLLIGLFALTHSLYESRTAAADSARIVPSVPAPATPAPTSLPSSGSFDLVTGPGVVIDLGTPGNYPGAIDLVTFIMVEESLTNRDTRVMTAAMERGDIVPIKTGSTVTILDFGKTRAGPVAHIELPNGRRAYVPPALLRSVHP